MVSLICRTEPNKKNNEENKTSRSEETVRGVSPAAGREPMVGTIGERGRFSAESESEGVMAGENGELTE